MSDMAMITMALVHTVYGALLRFVPERDEAHDRGAVSLEQVLWFVAVGVSVAVVSAIIWGKIKDEANKPVQAPAAP